MSQQRVFKRLVASSAILLALLATSNAYADDTAAEIKLLRAKLRELEHRLDNQETKVRAVRAAVVAAPVAGPGYAGGPVYKGDPRVPGIGPYQFGGVTITPGGFVALEGVYRSRALGSDFITPFQNIPYNQSVPGQVGEFRATPRQSRFSVLIQGKVNPVTTLSGYGEFDFGGAAQTANYNQSNSFTPRVRHLYATIDRDDYGFHVLAGQTWSLATASAKGLGPRQELIPLTIDGGYVPGFVYTRNAQLRLIKDLPANFSAAVSAENPATVYGGTVPSNIGTGAAGAPGGGTASPLVNGIAYGVVGATNNNNGNTITLNHVPDVIGKVAWDPTNFGRTVHVEGWGLGRDFTNRYQSLNAGVPGVTFGNPMTHDTFGGGGGGTILVSVIPKVLDVQVSGAYGRGIGRYGTAQLPDVTVGGDGQIKPLAQQAILVGLTYHALPELDLYAYAGREKTTSFTSTAFNGAQFGYGNGNFNNQGCSIENTAAATCVGNTKEIRQITGGFWDKIYSGVYGRLQIGAQYSYTQRFSFAGLNGATPAAANFTSVTARTDEHIVLGSLRYYPFQP